MNTKQKGVSLAGVGLVFGTAFGYLIGSAIGNIGLGIALGAPFGLTFAPVVIKKNRYIHKHSPLSSEIAMAL